MSHDTVVPAAGKVIAVNPVIQARLESSHCMIDCPVKAYLFDRLKLERAQLFSSAERFTINQELFPTSMVVNHSNPERLGSDPTKLFLFRLSCVTLFPWQLTPVQVLQIVPMSHRLSWFVHVGPLVLL